MECDVRHIVLEIVKIPPLVQTTKEVHCGAIAGDRGSGSWVCTGGVIIGQGGDIRMAQVLEHSRKHNRDGVKTTREIRCRAIAGDSI